MKTNQSDAIIIVDVFRAFTTACYILEKKPLEYVYASKSDVLSRLASNYSNAVLVGKPEIGANLSYDIPNSPTRTDAVSISNKIVLHRTEAGAKGVLSALKKSNSLVFASGLVNADATVNYIKSLNIKNVYVQPMGHEAETPSLEDDVCADYIKALLSGQKYSYEKFIPTIREKSGRYFFGEDQWQYPYQDFDRCLDVNRFKFAIQATARDDYAVLNCCDTNLLV